MFFYLEPERALLNDLNAPLMKFYEGVKDSYSRVSDELAELEQIYMANRKLFEEAKALDPDNHAYDPNEEFYYKMRDYYNGKETGKYTDAAVYYFINKTAYSGMIRYNKSGEYNVPYGRYKTFNTSKVTKSHSELLGRAALMCGDYSQVFELCKEGDFCFLDPPYDCVFSDYGNVETAGGFGEENHRRLAEAYYELPCKALMVIGKTDLTMELYGDSIVHEYKKSYAVNIRNRFKSEGKHILVANY